MTKKVERRCYLASTTTIDEWGALEDARVQIRKPDRLFCSKLLSVFLDLVGHKNHHDHNSGFSQKLASTESLKFRRKT